MWYFLCVNSVLLLFCSVFPFSLHDVRFWWANGNVNLINNLHSKINVYGNQYGVVCSVRSVNTIFILHFIYSFVRCFWAPSFSTALLILSLSSRVTISNLVFGKKRTYEVVHKNCVLILDKNATALLHNSRVPVPVRVRSGFLSRSVRICYTRFASEPNPGVSVITGKSF